MGILAILSSFFTSSVFGSVLGGLMAWLNRKQEIESKKLDLAQEEKRWAHERGLRADDLAIAQAEANAKVEVAQREGDASVEVARTKAIADTNAADAVSADELTAAGWWKWVLVLASAYRKSLRSVLTTVVGGFALYLNYKLAMQFDAFDLLPFDQQTALISKAVDWVSLQASAMFGYWFVARGSAEGKAR